MSLPQEINISAMPLPMKGNYNRAISKGESDIEGRIMDAQRSGALNGFSIKEWKNGSFSAYPREKSADLDTLLLATNIFPDFDVSPIRRDKDRDKVTDYYEVKTRGDESHHLASIFVRYLAQSSKETQYQLQ